MTKPRNKVIDCPPYPERYDTEAVLRDGSIIKLRPIRPVDTESWLAFLNRLSMHTKYLRFHHVPKQFVLEDAIRSCNVDYANTFALVAEVRKAERREIVAIGRYYRLPGKEAAEVALVIEDDYQRKGIGTRLMQALADVAREHGITIFEADVLAENKEMLSVLTNYGFRITSEMEAGVYRVTFPIVRTKKVAAKEEDRERISTLASLRSIMQPRSVAVIGASRDPDSLGHLVLQSILYGGFSGTVYPVNPNAEAVLSVKAYPSVMDIPGNVELAVIVVPAGLVARVADECGRKGVKALIVISDGFRERGAEGAALEKDLREITLGSGMRLVGPNCMGVINTDAAVRLNATFSRIFPPPGNIAFLSQSGAMGLVILEHARNLGMGISSFVSVGNRADISSNDLLQYWDQDEATRVILLYLESFGNPRKFSRLARQVSTRKPIIAVKGGRTPAGSRAASSHTGALATPEIVADALFQQAGIMRVNSVEELFDVANLLSNQPVPVGRRLAIVTNGGGPGIIAADACFRHGLALPELSAPTLGKLKGVVKREINLGNPLDLTAGGTMEEFRSVLKVLASDADNDAVLTIFIPPTTVDPQAMEEVIRSVIPAFRQRKKPLLACFVGQRGVLGKMGDGHTSVPCFLFPEEAVLALSKATEYGELTRRDTGSIPPLIGIKRKKASRIVESALTHSAQSPLWLSPEESVALLGCYGIRSTENRSAPSASRAAAIAAKIGFPVAVKLDSPTITHKTEVGGVKLNLKSADEVEQAFREIREELVRTGREKEMNGVTLQRMVNGGVEVIVGVTQDPSFGPLIMFGLGGIYAELLQDVALRLHPLTDRDARELIDSVKMVKLLDGFRGAPPADKPALEELLLRVSALVEDFPEIAELDMNPVKVMPQREGYWAVDARIRVR